MSYLVQQPDEMIAQAKSLILNRINNGLGKQLLDALQLTLDEEVLNLLDDSLPNGLSEVDKQITLLLVTQLIIYADLYSECQQFEEKIKFRKLYDEARSNCVEQAARLTFNLGDNLVSRAIYQLVKWPLYIFSGLGLFSHKYAAGSKLLDVVGKTDKVEVKDEKIANHYYSLFSSPRKLNDKKLQPEFIQQAINELRQSTYITSSAA